MIAMGTSYALGTDWYEPGLLTNSPEVVNLGTAYQEKAGAFSANGLSSWADGYFFSDLKVGGTGASDADANLKVSGKVGINLDEYGASEVPATTLDVNGSVRARSLSLAENPGTTYAAQVCADADGKLIVCYPDGTFHVAPDPGPVTSATCDYEERTWTVYADGYDGPINYTWNFDDDALRSPTEITLTSADGDTNDAVETYKIRIYRHPSVGFTPFAIETTLTGTSAGETAYGYGSATIESEKQYSIDHPEAGCPV